MDSGAVQDPPRRQTEKGTFFVFSRSLKPKKRHFFVAGMLASSAKQRYVFGAGKVAKQKKVLFLFFPGFSNPKKALSLVPGWSPNRKKVPFLCFPGLPNPKTVPGWSANQASQAQKRHLFWCGRVGKQKRKFCCFPGRLSSPKPVLCENW